jgi:hypothetical protein
MSERFGLARGDSLDGLERELVELGRALAYPQASPAFASRVTATIRSTGARPRRGWFGLPMQLVGRPIRRAVLLAVVLLLVLAAVAAAIGLGLPGLRITFGGPGATPIVVPSRTPVASASPGAAMGLGMPIPVADVESRAGFHVALPTDARFGAPDTSYLLNGRVTFVWGPRDAVRDTLEPGVSLVVSEFRGRLDPGYFEKVINTGTTLTHVTVDGQPGFWISGDPHFFFYVDPSGQFVEDTHRAVGDTLLWTAAGVTYRVESSLGMADTIALAESMR